MAIKTSALLLVLTSGFVATSFGAVAWEKSREDPDFPGQCMWENKDGALGRYPPPIQMYEVGESWDIGGCAQARCLKHGEELYIQYVTCGSVGAEPPCVVLPQNLTLSYPECCPSIWCPETPHEPTDISDKINEIENEIWDDEGMYQNLYQYI